MRDGAYEYLHSVIRHDYDGHTYPDDPSQNQGPHFNDPNDGHYNYQGPGEPYGPLRMRNNTMIDLKKSYVENLNSENEDLWADAVAARALKGEPPVLSVMRFDAKAPPSFHRYGHLVEICCDAAVPLMQKLEHIGYSPWLLLVGVVISDAQLLRFPNYALSGSAHKAGVIGNPFVEATFAHDNKKRVAGLYLIPWDRFCAACSFANRAVYPLIILTRRAEFASEGTLELIVRLGANDADGVATPYLDWRPIAAVLCPNGDIVVQIDGSFDDRERTLNIIHLQASLNNPARFALHDR